MKKILSSTIIEAAKPKLIEEFIGRVNSKSAELSIAKMNAPAGWSEPGQTPEFDEYTLVLKGELRVESGDGMHIVKTGETVIAMDSLQHLGCIRRRIYRRLHPGIFTGNSSP